MLHQLTFQIRDKYDSLADGITLEATLEFCGKVFTCPVKVDPGAQVCLFSREIGETLEIDVESGVPRRFRTLTGALLAYGHEATLFVCGLRFDSLLYFAADYGLPRNLLGREGWLQKVRLALLDYDATLYLSPHDFGEIT